MHKVTMSLPNPASDEQQRLFLEAQRLAAIGQTVCRKCLRQGALEGAISMHYGGAIAMALCVDCLGKVDVVIASNANGIHIEFRPKGNIVLAG